MRIFVTFLFVFFASISFAQSFSNLEHKVQFGGDIKYNSTVAEEIFEERKNDDYLLLFDLVKIRINPKSDVYYLIQFDEGPSADPNYTIMKVGANDKLSFVGNIACEKLIIPGNGYLYSEGLNNNLYNKRQKFKIENDKIVEMPQGAYYIGLNSKTRELITLYADKNKTKKAAYLPKNYNVEIVIEEAGWFLIKTPFGLTGWISKKDIKVYPPPHSTFEGLYMRGD